MIRNLQNNCNREERWELIREDVRELKASMEAIKSRLEEIERKLSTHTISQSTAARIFKEYRDFFWVAAMGLLTLYFEMRGK